MSSNGRELLSALKAELDFAEKGGYRSAARTPWRPKFIFQDSPTCLNFNTKENPRPCTECVLILLVPQERRGDKVPCRQIPLSERGDTIDFYYRTGTQVDLETALTSWLKATIQKLETEKREAESHSGVEELNKVVSNAG